MKPFFKAPKGVILSPEDLTSKQLNMTAMDDILSQNVAIELGIERAIEDAVRIGTEIAKQLEQLKPVTRALIVKTLFEHSQQQDKKVFKALKSLGI